MDKFKVLPTDERFLSLTDYQFMWILSHMELDVEEAKKPAQGEGDTFYDEGFDEWLEQVEEEDGERYF